MPTGTFIECRKENACSLVRDQSCFCQSPVVLVPRRKSKGEIWPGESPCFLYCPLTIRPVSSHSLNPMLGAEMFSLTSHMAAKQVPARVRCMERGQHQLPMGKPCITPLFGTSFALS